jgi:hypothetical protein
MKYRLSDLSVQDQAYYILVAINGSWIYNALHARLKDEALCAEIVREFLLDNEGGELVDDVETFINESHDDLLEFRKNKKEVV